MSGFTIAHLSDSERPFQDHPAPAGTVTGLDPEPMRRVVNRSDGNVMLIVCAPRTSGYTPPDRA
jgi:hypothetical protein